jgi:hypothetical protein
MEGADPITAAPAIPFDVCRDYLHLHGLSERDIRQLERNDEFMHLQFRHPEIAWSFFRVPELFDKLVSRAALRQIHEDANPKVISKAIKRGLADPEHRREGTATGSRNH